MFYERRLEPYANRSEVVVARRNAPNDWSTFVLDQEKSGRECLYTNAPGTCADDYEIITPLAIVSAGGPDARFLYSKMHVTGSHVAMCEPAWDGVELTCTWSAAADLNVTGDLHVGWLDSSATGHAVAAPGVFAYTATAAVDTTGVVHIALFNDEYGSEVRYLSLAATP